MQYHNEIDMTRRALLATLGASAVTAPNWVVGREQSVEFKLDYMLASCMYGKLDVQECIAQVTEIGATYIDLWPPSHGDQRDQIDSIGHNHYLKACVAAGVKPQMTTRYDL